MDVVPEGMSRDAHYQVAGKLSGSGAVHLEHRGRALKLQVPVLPARSNIMDSDTSGFEHFTLQCQCFWVCYIAVNSPYVVKTTSNGVRQLEAPKGHTGFGPIDSVRKVYLHTRRKAII